MNLDNSGPKLSDFATRPPGSRTFCVVYMSVITIGELLVVFLTVQVNLCYHMFKFKTFFFLLITNWYHCFSVFFELVGNEEVVTFSCIILQVSY